MTTESWQQPPINIRTFKYPDDFPAVIHLWSTAGPGVHVGRSDEAREIEKKLQRDPDLFLVAEQQGEIIGTVLGGFDGRRGLVYHLAVAQNQRQNGLGDQLMQELERRLHSKGCIRCYLLVTTDNQPAINFYEKRGWERMQLLIYAKNIGGEATR